MVTPIARDPLCHGCPLAPSQHYFALGARDVGLRPTRIIQGIQEWYGSGRTCSQGEEGKKRANGALSGGVSGYGLPLGGATPTGAAAWYVPVGYILERSYDHNALLFCPCGKLVSWRLEPLVSVVPERCAHWAGRGTSCFFRLPDSSPSLLVTAALLLLTCVTLACQFARDRAAPYFVPLSPSTGERPRRVTRSPRATPPGPAWARGARSRGQVCR